MIEFFLDTSTKYVTISILKDGKQIYFFHDKIFEDLSVKILPLIDNALNECSIKIDDVGVIYVVVGPGSFTGIRIGLTIVKTWAWTLKKNVIPISSLELIASTNIETDYIVPFIDARRGNCFIGVYDNQLNTVKKDQFANFEEFINNIDNSKTYTLVTYDNLENYKYITPKIDVIKLIKNTKMINQLTHIV